jgi:hypothetical protein
MLSCAHLLHVDLNLLARRRAFGPVLRRETATQSTLGLTIRPREIPSQNNSPSYNLFPNTLSSSIEEEASRVYTIVK